MTPAAGPMPAWAVPATELPDWVTRLAAAAADLSAADISRVPMPVEGAGRQSAVLILLAGADPAAADVLLLRRSSTMRNHAGQIAFPGGASDPTDSSPTDTALREATEEVGLQPASVSVLGVLPTLYLPPSGFSVSPVLGFWRQPHPVGVVDEREVAAVGRLPLMALAQPSARFTVRHPSGFTGPGFEVDGWLVWGFTAGLISVLLKVGGFQQPWNTEVIRASPA